MSQNKKLLQFISEQMNKPTKPKVPRNQWQHPGETTVIPSRHITMKGVTYPVVGVDANGLKMKMLPGRDYLFTKGPVTEYPMMQAGGQRGGEYVDSVLNANKDLDWVKRLYEQNTPSMKIKGQKSRATHFMESGDNRVYPTIVRMPDGRLKYLGRDAYDYADSTNTFIQFPTEQDAQWFGRNYKKGRNVLKEFQPGGQSGIPLIPSVRNNNYGDISSYYPRPNDSFRREEMKRVVNAEAQSTKYGTIKPGKKQNAVSKAMAIAANPVSAARYVVRGQRIPDNFEKGSFNPYDLATTILNPASAIYAGAQIPGNLRDGEFLQAGLNSLAVIPGLKTVPKATRAAINVADRNFSKVGKALSAIEKEGRAAGLNDFDIAKRQLDEVGITANQRQGYVPGVSELARKYITPYGYSGMGSGNKLKEIIQNIKRGGIDYSDEIINSQITPARADAWNMYLGYPQRNNTFRMAETAPVNHRAYSRKQLENMDIYSLNNDAGIIEDFARSAENTTPAGIRKAIDNLKSDSFVEVDPLDVMGNYNARFTNNGLQYNDIWDLEPSISFVKLLPKRVRNMVDENPLFYKKTIYPGTKTPMYTPKNITVNVSKFFGKPYMSHGNVNLTAKDYQNRLLNKMQNNIDYLNNQILHGVGSSYYAPKMAMLQEQMEAIQKVDNYRNNLYQLNNIYPIRKEGGNIPNAQNGPPKSSYIPLVPLQRSNAYGDIQQYYPDVSKSLKQDQLKKYVDTQRLKNASTIRPSNNQGAISKAISIIANPLTAASYLAKGQRIPDNFDKAESNIYDIATNIVNPIGSIYDVSSGIGDIRRGDYASAAANLAFGLTGLPSIPVYAKNAIKEYDPSLYDAIKHVRHSNSESYRRFKTNPEEYIESYANEKKLTKNEKGNWIEPFTGSEYTNKQIRKEIENNFSKERKLTSDKLKNLGFIGLIESGKIAAPIMTKTPGLNKIYKDLAYKVASVSGGKQRLDVNHFWDVLTKNKDEFLKYHDKYTGVDGGEELFKRNLLKLYIYGDNKEFVKSKLVPRGLDKYTKKYGDLDVYEMFSDIPSGGALDLAPEDLTTMFKGDKNNPQSFGQIIRKLKKEGFVSSPKEMQDNPIIPLDDIGGHMVYLTKNAPKQHSLVSQDIWKFTPDDYTSRWAAEHASGIPNPLDKYLVRTQSTLMDYAGKPFVLMQENPIRYMKQRNPSKNPPMIDPLEWDMDNSGSFDDYKYGGEMIKRADGSYSRRGLWDNIRANKGSGKRPTKEMLAKERKIKAQEKQFGGSIPVGSYMYENPYLMNEGGEPDGAMALGQIDAAINKLMNLRKFIQPNSDLEPWVSSKLTIMDDYADAVNDYMQYNPETQEEGLSTMKEGGGIPDRYKNMGFTKTGVKKKSNRPGKKWMVLAKKGDQYKVVHGGYKGMQDYTQHNNEQRRKNFWSRMGGKNSSKATDPFSPLYWHKRFGTWQEGGGVPAPIPIPYSREYLAALNNEYNQFYAPPRYYGKDDGYDAFHHFKSQMYPTRQQDSGSGWVTNYGDYESFTHGSKDKPPKSKPGRTYKFVDHYITDYKDNMNMPFLISEIMNTNRRNEIVPAYRREEYKKGGSTWSGNTWYKSGGYVDGDILDLSPEQAEILKAAGYEFEIIEP